MKAKTAINILGQLRLYSLVDLILMLLAGGVTNLRVFAPTLAWVGFLSYLEHRHKDVGRAIVPKWVAIVFAAFSLALFYFFPQGLLRGALFSIFSYGYAKKKQGCWGLASPFCRGFQVLAILGPSAFGLLAAIATVIRNVLGDWRDVEKDRTEGLKTWPVMLGVKSDWLFLHLFATFATTWIWWHRLSFVAAGLLGVWAFQTSIYWLTPRGKSNDKALAKIKALSRHIL